MATEMKVGQRVCWLGYGTAATSHCHGEIVRITKTMIIVKSDSRGAQWRFRKDNMQAVPRGDWGGHTLSTKCQRPRRA